MSKVVLLDPFEASALKHDAKRNIDTVFISKAEVLLSLLGIEGEEDDPVQKTLSTLEHITVNAGWHPVVAIAYSLLSPRRPETFH